MEIVLVEHHDNGSGAFWELEGMQEFLKESFREAQNLGAENLLPKAYGELRNADCKDIRPKFPKAKA